MAKRRKPNELTIHLTPAEMKLVRLAAKIADMTLGNWSACCVAGESSRYVRNRTINHARVGPRGKRE